MEKAFYPRLSFLRMGTADHTDARGFGKIMAYKRTGFGFTDILDVFDEGSRSDVLSAAIRVIRGQFLLLPGQPSLSVRFVLSVAQSF